jgi:hypothetical protein
MRSTMAKAPHLEETVAPEQKRSQAAKETQIHIRNEQIEARN